MKRFPPWLVSMFAGLLVAALLGGVGAHPLLVVVGGVTGGLLAQRAQRRTVPLLGLLGAALRARGGPFAAGFGRAGGSSGRRAPSAGTTVPPGEGGPGRGRAVRSPIRVRCELVTPRFQVWHSTDTGRAYEVVTDRGVPDAAPGDLGTLSFERGRPRVERRVVN